MPLWIKHIHKLARYHSATKAMVKLATRQPDIFTSIHVEAVEAPGQERFSLANDITALKTTLKRLTKTDPGSLVEKLGQTWLTDDPEARFHRACRLNLTVHAECSFSPSTIITQTLHHASCLWAQARRFASSVTISYPGTHWRSGCQPVIKSFIRLGCQLHARLRCERSIKPCFGTLIVIWKKRFSVTWRLDLAFGDRFTWIRLQDPP